MTDAWTILSCCLGTENTLSWLCRRLKGLSTYCFSVLSWRAAGKHLDQWDDRSRRPILTRRLWGHIPLSTLLQQDPMEVLIWNTGSLQAWVWKFVRFLFWFVKPSRLWTVRGVKSMKKEKLDFLLIRQVDLFHVVVLIPWIAGHLFRLVGL